MIARPFRRVLLLVVAVTLAGAAVLGHAGAAAAVTDERIAAYAVDITVNPDGSARFREVITYDFGPNARHGIDRVLTTAMHYDDARDRRYPLTVVSVSAVGAPADYEVSSVGGGRQRIRIGDPDRTVTGAHTYTITYRLDGVVNAQPGDDELYWNVTGDRWPVAIDRAEVAVHVPGGPTRVTCFAGPSGSTTSCDLATIVPVRTPGAVADTVASFAQGALAPAHGLSVVVAIPDTDGDATEPQPILVDATLDDPRGFSDMFAATPVTVGATGALAIVAAAVIARLQFLVGRDRRGAGSATDAAFSTDLAEGERVPLRDPTAIPVEFVPPDRLRPAQLGLIVDEVVHPRDISATIVDLAVRGHLRIEEITEGTKIKDYRLVELRGEDERTELLEYERFLLGKLFAARTEVDLSDLKNTFASSMTATRKKVYENGTANGWFAARPDHVRTIWALVGFVVLAVGALATFFVAAASKYGLITLPVAAAGLVIAIGARWMPRRTPKGTGLYRRTKGFEDFIENSEKHRAAFAERANIFTEYLPYAVAFGATKKWADALSVLGLAPPDTSLWYVGRGPIVWTTFGDRMSTFTSTTTSTLTSTPGGSGSSGFGGGGFSGGGGGGGGGGSW